MHGTYCGSLEHLKGEGALLQEVPGSDNVKAQFDSFDVSRHGVDLAHGWHLFRKDEFKINLPPELEIPPWIQSALGMNKR